MESRYPNRSIQGPNMKFFEIAEDAERATVLAGEIAGLFREATQDGINAYREQIIRRNCNIVEQIVRNLREELKPKVGS